MPAPLRSALFAVALVAAACARPPAAVLVAPSHPSDPAQAEPTFARGREPVVRLGDPRLRHALAGQALAFSPDGKCLYSGGADGRVVAWDAATGAAARRYEAHPDGVYAVALAPDGRTLAASGQGAVWAWETATGRPRWRAAAGEYGAKTLAFAPDGRALVGGCWDGLVRVWDAATGAEARRFSPLPDEPGPGWVNAAVSPDGRTLATSGYRDSVRLWDAATGAERRTVPLSRASPLAFSPDGRLLVGDGPEDRTTVYDARTGDEVARAEKYRTVVEAVAFAPDGRRFATAGWDEAAVWDAATCRPLVVLPRRFGHAKAVAWSPDGLTVAVGGEDGVIRLYDPATGRERLPPAGHQARVSALAVTPDGRRLVSGGWDRSVRVWNLPAGREARVLTWDPLPEDGTFADRSRAGSADKVSTVSVSPDGRRVAVGAYHGPIRVWGLATGREAARVETGTLGAGAVALLGDEVLVGGMNGTFGVWDVAGRRPPRVFSKVTAVRRLTVTPDGGAFAVQPYASPLRVEVRSLKSGEVQASFDIPQDGADRSGGPSLYVAYSPDGKALVVAHGDRIAVPGHRPGRVFDLASKTEKAAFGGRWVTAVAFAPDGRRVATAEDGEVALWDATTGAEVGRWGTGQWGVAGLAFAPDGRTVFTGGGDGTVCGWAVGP